MQLGVSVDPFLHREGNQLFLAAEWICCHVYVIMSTLSLLHWAAWQLQRWIEFVAFEKGSTEEGKMLERLCGLFWECYVLCA